MYYKKDIINRIAELTYLKKQDIELILLAFGEVMSESVLKDDGLTLFGYFTIKHKYCRPRHIVNKNIQVPGKIKLKFVPKIKLKQALDELNGVNE